VNPVVKGIKGIGVLNIKLVSPATIVDMNKTLAYEALKLV
jgi:hypothetical protein